METAYQLKTKSIIHELLDDEIILANLDTGTYYSIRESGVPIWQMLMMNQGKQGIMNALLQHYPHIAEAKIHTETEAHLQQLLNADILTANTQENTVPPDEKLLAWAPEYHSPLFEQYDDMKNLLMLDPIHEVDEQGWPAKA